MTKSLLVEIQNKSTIYNAESFNGKGYPGNTSLNIKHTSAGSACLLNRLVNRHTKHRATLHVISKTTQKHTIKQSKQLNGLKSNQNTQPFLKMADFVNK